MKAEELRIGNLVSIAHESNNPFFGIKTFYENGVHVGGGKCYGFDLLLPIPLTEEWLIKLGAKLVLYIDSIGTGEYEFNRWFMLNKVGGNTNTYQLCLSGRYLPVNINFIHQLQNLFFALTQTELTIKL